jgi:3-oxoacyl-[acyl-carrier protein] reductase
MVVRYGQQPRRGESGCAEIKAAGGKAVAIQGNVDNSADVKRLFQETIMAFGKLDILVNNAGVIALRVSNILPKNRFTGCSISTY